MNNHNSPDMKAAVQIVSKNAREDKRIGLDDPMINRESLAIVEMVAEGIRVGRDHGFRVALFSLKNARHRWGRLGSVESGGD